MPNWDPELYLKYGDERTRPAIDLLARVSLASPQRIIDLGCGPGNSTALLRQRWAEADLSGLDHSAEMIAKARTAYPDQIWLDGDVRGWEASEPYDLIFSNAALHWVPNHTDLFPRLMRFVSSGGALAVQMPVHFRSTVHEMIHEVANQAPWASRLMEARKAVQVGRPEFYYDLLRPFAAKIEIWETEYVHVMDGPIEIFEWIRGASLRPFVAALGDDREQRDFEGRCLQKLIAAYPRRPDGKVLFPFRRIFMTAYRNPKQ